MTEEQKMNLSIFDITKGKTIRCFLEDYIVQVLAFYLGEDFSIEVIKAHAIMIRTYIMRKMRLFDGKGCEKHSKVDLCNDPKHCLGSISIEEIPNDKKERLISAVKDTQNKVITFHGKLIYPYYHNTCGGATENSERVFGNTIQYARRVLCDHCKSTSPYWQSLYEFSLEDLEEKLNIHFPRYGPTKGTTIHSIIDEVERDEAGRVIRMNIGDKTFKGSEIQEKLGLNSTRFGWEPISIKFFAQGKGHGVGLCQYGAQGLALQGKTAEEILKYYFTGVKVENIIHGSIKKPLQGKIILIDPGHGGRENGIEKDGVIEKDINLKISLILKDQLESAGASIFLTRREDRYVSLLDRLNICNELQPHFMISIHRNEDPIIDYVTQIYVYPGDKEAYSLGKAIVNKFQALEMSTREVIETDLYLTRESKQSVLILELGYFPLKDQNLKKIGRTIYSGILSYWGIEEKY